MNKLIPLITFSVLLLVPVGTQNAWALNCESTGTGFWDQSSTWSNCGGGIPGNADTATINSGDTVTVRTLVNLDGLTLIVNPFGNLITDGSLGARMILSSSSSLINRGNIDLFDAGPTAGEIRLNTSTGTNACSGTITTHGSTGVNDAQFVLLQGSQFTNKGVINLNGGSASSSGILGVGGADQLDNHGIINENPGSGANSGVVRVLSGGVFNDNLPSLCIGVGGELISLDTTALLLAGVQTPMAWMMYAFSAIGIGAFLFTRNTNNIRNVKVILQDYLDRFG